MTSTAFFKRRLGTVLLALLLCGMIIYFFSLPENRPAMASAPLYDLIIDPGHGGADGGAVSDSGACEAPINLSISMKMRDILVFFGRSPMLTRTDEGSLDHNPQKTIRENKSADLHARLKISADNPGLPFLSIHQNMFSDPAYSGAQVFYSTGSEASEPLAAELQAALVECLDKNNKRVHKKAPEGVFLMDKITAPAVTVECGFLSNPGEAEKLADDVYQTKTALAVSLGFLRYSGR